MAKAAKLILKYVFVLTLFCGVAGALLSLVYDLTAPRIEAQRQKMEEDGLHMVFPGTYRITPKADYYEAVDEEGRLAGYVIKVKSHGYSSDIEMLVGLRRENTKELKVTGVKILAQAETPGLGSRVESRAFLDNLHGRVSRTLRLKKDGGELDAITGATITSRAVIDGLRKSIDAFESAL